MRHKIDNEVWYSWTDIKDGRYSYWEKGHGKITLERLEELVKEGFIKSLEVPVAGTPYTFIVFNESDIIYALAKSKFKEKINIEKWFK